MASLYKKPVWVRDPTTGAKVKTKSKKWWGQYKDALGTLRRVPLAADKTAAQAMLNGLTRHVEREKAGLVDPTDEQRKRPLALHVAEFENYLANKGVMPKQVGEAIRMLKRMIAHGNWKFIANISASDALDFLGQLRRDGLSAQTYNHHLKAAKQFTRWLVRDRRNPHDPLVHLSRLNVSADRRHDRRALSAEEFRRLIEAARASSVTVENVSGLDRAMIYVLAAWTGFRKGEIGSLTLQSLRLNDNPPTATIDACYSKRRRRDMQILHPELVRQLREWLATKDDIKPTEPLFPISGRVPGGIDRKTYKMVERDLIAARDQWIDEGKTPDEKLARERSDFLCYCNHAGLFADFHSMRHLFITSLERAGISPKMAQTLARHSDIRLTLGVYTHVGLNDQTIAIESLPGPPA
jgi:site-specific recombinase XerD